MPHVPLIDELALLMMLGVVGSIVLAKVRFPTTAGLLLVGALSGPSGLGLIRSVDEILLVAEIGVVLLLFTIGLELSIDRVRSIARFVFVGGSIQVLATIAAVTLIAIAFEMPPGKGIFYGFIVALSSTAIVLAGLSERGEVDAPHGRFVMGVLIFQDLCVAPMVVLVPLLAGRGDGGAAAITKALGIAAITVGVVLLLGRWLFPRLLRWVDGTRSREVFVMAVVGVCIGTAWLTSLGGLSLALGAFLGGMTVAGTEYRHRALGDVLPLRDLFASVFFVSLGMLFDVRIVTQYPIQILLIFLAFTFGKGLIATLAAVAMKFPARVAWLAGVGLSQFGEFGFVLATLARGTGLIEQHEIGIILAAGLPSMFLTPVLARLAPHMSAGEKMLRPLEKLLGARGMDEPEQRDSMVTGHVVVVGLGVAGRRVVDALMKRGVRVIALEINAESVRRARADGVDAYYADVTSDEALHHARIELAQGVVVSINDFAALGRGIAAIRRVSSTVPVFARTRFVLSRKDLEALGATHVVCDEEEAGQVMADMVSHHTHSQPPPVPVSDQVPGVNGIA